MTPLDLPPLPPDLRAAALGALDAISVASLDAAAAPARDPSLGMGLAGIALMHGALVGFFPERPHARLAETCLERAIELLGEEDVGLSLLGGCAGVAWASDRLRPPWDDPADDPNEAVDEALGEALREGDWRGEHDLVSGLCGLGTYALDRPPGATTHGILSLVVDHLEATAVTFESGVAWLTDPASIEAEIRGDRRELHADLGLAHGVPGVIVFLARAFRRGVEGDRVSRLLERSASWVRAQRLGAGFASSFPPFVGPGIGARASRLAWCRGDLPVGCALLAAADALGEPAWRHDAVAIARAAARRSDDTSEIMDAGLCHGAFGASHIFGSLYRQTGDETLLDASRRWMRHGLRERQPESPLGGFRAQIGERNGDRHWAFVPGLLTGAAGVALALATAISADTPPWDGALLTGDGRGPTK